MRACDHGEARHGVLVLGQVRRIVGRRAEAAQIDCIGERAAVDRQRIGGTGSESIDFGGRSRNIGRGAPGDLVGDQRSGAARRALGNGEGAGEHRGIVAVAGQHRDVVVRGHVGAAGDIGGHVGAHQIGRYRARQADLRRDRDTDRHCRDRPGRIRADTDVAGNGDQAARHAGAHGVCDVAIDDRQSRRRTLRRGAADGGGAGDLRAVGRSHR